MEYNFIEIERKWQDWWAEHKTYQAQPDSSKPKYYVLDMFPYPSGAGLHVGHPLGYIASDIFSRYKRLKGFNVLHPMGYDAFGLPAEQYAIQTGQHPEKTTHDYVARYRSQLDRIGFSFDWDREFRTCDPDYYTTVSRRPVPSRNSSPLSRRTDPSPSTPRTTTPPSSPPSSGKPSAKRRRPMS